MKKIFLLGFAMITLGIFTGQETAGIRFENSNLATALAKAKQEDKLLFVDMYASWCGPCKYMSEKVFTQKKVGDYFNSTFVNAKFDVEKGEGVTMARRYGVDAYPTFLLLDGDGRLVGKLVGGSDADDFIAKIKKLAANARK